MTQNAGNSKRYGIVVFFASACTLLWILWIPKVLHSQGILPADVLRSSANGVISSLPRAAYAHL